MVCIGRDDEICGNLRVGAGVGHGKDTRALVATLEVLISELLTVDGLATSALIKNVMSAIKFVIDEKRCRPPCP